MIKLELGDKLILKKGHPCGANLWVVERVGADVKLKCSGCGRMIVVNRPDLLKRIKKIEK
jgi:hypothetical protein